MTTNTSITQINWNEFRHKCAELEQECSNLQGKSSRSATIFEDSERSCESMGHTDDGLKGECLQHEMACTELCNDFSDLCEKLSDLSNNCITLGHKKSNQQLNEYADIAEKLKGVLTENESKIPEIRLKLTGK